MQLSGEADNPSEKAPKLAKDVAKIQKYKFSLQLKKYVVAKSLFFKISLQNKNNSVAKFEKSGISLHLRNFIPVEKKETATKENKRNIQS